MTAIVNYCISVDNSIRQIEGILRLCLPEMKHDSVDFVQDKERDASILIVFLFPNKATRLIHEAQSGRA